MDSAHPACAAVLLPKNVPDDGAAVCPTHNPSSTVRDADKATQTDTRVGSTRRTMGPARIKGSASKSGMRQFHQPSFPGYTHRQPSVAHNTVLVTKMQTQLVTIDTILPSPPASLARVHASHPGESTGSSVALPLAENSCSKYKTNHPNIRGLVSCAISISLEPSPHFCQAG
jgi:hypothetical protein